MKSILYFSLVDWFWIKQRPHHIPEILSKNNRVVYLCFSSWRGAKHLVNSHLSEQKYFKRSYFKVNKNLIVIRKKILPPKNMGLLNIAYKPAKSFLDRHIKRYIKKLANITNISFIEDKEDIPEDSMSAVTGGAEIFIPSEELIDYDAEKSRLTKEKDRLRSEVQRIEKKLAEKYDLNKLKNMNEKEMLSEFLNFSIDLMKKEFKENPSYEITKKDIILEKTGNSWKSKEYEKMLNKMK